MLLGGRTEFNAWAMTAPSRGTYDTMRDGSLPFERSASLVELSTA